MSKPIVLILESDEIAADYLQDVLFSLNAEFIYCKKLKQVMQTLKQRSVALLLLDVASLGQDLKTWQSLRQAARLAPLIALSQQHDIKTRIALLQAGADDIILKPFHNAELHARIQAYLRQHQRYMNAVPIQAIPPVLQKSNLKLEPSNCHAEYLGAVLPLSKTEFQLLYILAKQAPKTCTRQQLIQYVWPFDPPSARTLDQYIRHLRRQFAHLQLPADLQITTVHRQGYRLSFGQSAAS